MTLEGYRKRELDELELEEKVQLEELYRALGKAYYEGGYEDPLPELLPMLDDITAILYEEEPEVEEPEEEANKVECRKCGALIAEDALFCDECGASVNEPEPESEPVVPAGKVCRNCGNVMRPGANFCGRCGAPSNF